MLSSRGMVVRALLSCGSVDAHLRLQPCIWGDSFQRGRSLYVPVTYCMHHSIWPSGSVFPPGYVRRLGPFLADFFL